MDKDLIAGQGLAFSFVIYITPCNAGINRLEDSARTTQERVELYTPGLLQNAAFLDSEFSKATMLVHIPQNEMTLKPMQDFVKVLSSFRCVRIIAFDPRDVAADVWQWNGVPTITAEWTLPGAPMEMGQKLRCARYLPLFSSCDSFDAIVFRDADSLLTRTDATLIRKWLNSGAGFLVYKEHKTKRGLAMGGGIGVRLALLPTHVHSQTMREAILHMRGTKDVQMLCDEGFIISFLPPTLSEVYEGRSAVREAPKQTPRNLAFMLVFTRMTKKGSYFVWNPRTKTCGELLWPHLREQGVWNPPKKPSESDWIR